MGFQPLLFELAKPKDSHFHDEMLEKHIQNDPTYLRQNRAKKALINTSVPKPPILTDILLASSGCL